MLNTLYNKRCCAYASQGSRHNTFFQKERVFMKSKKKINNRDITLFLFVIPAVVLYCMFFIYPIINGLYYSMTAVSYTHLDVYKRQVLAPFCPFGSNIH